MCVLYNSVQNHTNLQTGQLQKHSLVFEFGCEQLAFIKADTWLINPLLQNSKLLISKMQKTAEMDSHQFLEEDYPGGITEQ